MGRGRLVRWAGLEDLCGVVVGAYVWDVVSEVDFAGEYEV